MTPEPDLIYRIFSDALQLPSDEERGAYIKRACGPDLELHRLVEKLLRAKPKAEDFLERPFESRATANDYVAEAAGTVIGPYKLLQQIGEGGMGTVYLAEQREPLCRKVALKILKPGMDSRQVVARFEAERQALALMDHPNIARVLDAGTTDGDRPYFVMELVKGIPITTYCDQRRLSTRERVQLFVPVCQAVQHAHTKGIIHRDLKPSNVLVALYDGKPVPKVIDFGVAKAMGQKLTERTLFTDFGTVVGTLEYMSPEQAEVNQLDIDTRSDSYSLGVLLYELLAGSTPLQRQRLKEGALLEALRLIREEEPPTPSQGLSTSQTLATLSAQRGTEPAKLARLMRGELDWIVMRALDKDRNRRYETANAFAADIGHYLHDEPVQAGPPGVAYRLRKFARRHRGPVLAAALVLAALVAGVFGTTMALVRAVKSEQDALKGWAEANANAQKANAAAEREREARKRADNARHALQMDLASDLCARYDVSEAERVLDDVDGPFQQTWEQRHLRDWCQRKAFTLPAHQGEVTCVAISGDGRYIVSACQDGTVQVWDVATRQRKHTLKGHQAAIQGVAVSNDGGLIASASWDGMVKLWDAHTGRERLTLRGHECRKVHSVAISGDAQRIVSGGTAALSRYGTRPAAKSSSPSKDIPAV
jgi:serine/threonine protein kinase